MNVHEIEFSVLSCQFSEKPWRGLLSERLARTEN
jgi:hypothetical protein